MSKQPAKTDRVAETFENLTAKVIEAIEADPGNWTRPWSEGILDHGLPTSVKGHIYAGGNALVTLVVGIDRGYSSAVWGTYNQWAEFLGEPKRGGRVVRKGERSTYLLRPRTITVDQDQDGNKLDKPKTFVRFTAFPVFNADQVHGAGERLAELSAKEGPTPNPIESAEAFIANTGASINHGVGGAFYRPSTDSINLPPLASFTDAESYYSTAVHELGHWTGAAHRLNREGITGKRTSATYAFEELIAELTAVFVGSGTLGLSVEPRPDHAQYLSHWLGQLREDPKALWRAASGAAKAAEHLQDLQAGATLQRAA
jgi:antirestriction protein ArdC